MDLVLAENNNIQSLNSRLQAQLDEYDSKLNVRRDLQSRYANLCHLVTDVYHLMRSVHQKGLNSVQGKKGSKYHGMPDADLVPDVNNTEQILIATKQLITFWEPTKFSSQLHNLTVLGEKQFKSILQVENPRAIPNKSTSQPYDTFKEVGLAAIRRQRCVGMAGVAATSSPRIILAPRQICIRFYSALPF
jgi:hypothetical protein